MCDAGLRIQGLKAGNGNEKTKRTMETTPVGDTGSVDTKDPAWGVIYYKNQNSQRLGTCSPP